MNMSWYQAQDVCRQGQSSLPNIRSFEELSHLLDLVRMNWEGPAVVFVEKIMASIERTPF